MTGEEILQAIYDGTPADQGGLFERLCGPSEPEVLSAVIGILTAFNRDQFSPIILTALVFNLGVYCADRGLASTIPEIQERRRNT